MDAVLDQPALRERDRQKAACRQAQVEARLLAVMVNARVGTPVLEVSAAPQVWLVEEGAFVEAVIWVPRRQDAEREG